MEELQKIKIIYEDNHILVVFKPANMPVCEDSSRDKDLLSELKEFIKVRDKKPGNVYLGLVHRLDRPVSGIMVFAKTSKAASRLGKQVMDHSFKKVYAAVVYGKPSLEGKFLDYLKKDEKKNISYVVDKSLGKEARLTYKRLDYKEKMSLVEIYLETGRSHQIRVQFSSRGYPLVGDVKYNKEQKPGIDIALVAKKITFQHPTTKEIMSFEVELPKRYPFNLF